MRKLLPLLLLVPATLSAQAAPRAFTPNDWYKVTTVSSPAMSPDGDRVAFTVTTVAVAENRRHSEVWMAETAGGDPIRLTSPVTESSNPRWSPDGRLLFFSSTRRGSSTRTWALRMDQPGGEAFEYDSAQAGSLSRDRGVMAWADPVPEDSSARRRGDDPYAKMPSAARPPYGAITQPVDPARFDGRHYVDMPIKGNGRGFLTNPREARRWQPSQIWVATQGSAKRQVTNTAYSHRSVTISPNGAWIAFIADAQLRPDSVVSAERDSLSRLPYDAKRETGRNDSDIFVVSASGGEPRRLIRMVGNEGDVSWSPDGQRIAFTNSPTRTGQTTLYVVPVAGGTPRDLLPNWQYEPGNLDWLPSGEIMMSASIGGSSQLFRVNPATGAHQAVVGGRRRASGFSWDTAGRRVAYISTSIAKPTELFVADANGVEQQLSHFNDKLNREIGWADAERFTYKSVGGFEIEGWLMKPFGYEAGKKYPLVLYIHGGPHSSYGETWFDEFQNLAGAGMMVLFTNPRGSSGYGAKFTYSTRGEWGDEDYQDLMKAVDIAAARPDVDSTRMGVTGGSYGGFMTAWVTTRTNRFKAAQTDRMIVNWTSWYGQSDAQGLTEFEFYGKPWENWKLYDELSPLRHVTNVKTPTLIVQSEEDHRTPIGDAEQWFNALIKLGVPVEFVRYPRSTHDLSRTGEPWLLVDRLGRLRQWFSHYLGGEGDGAVAAN